MEKIEGEESRANDASDIEYKGNDIHSNVFVSPLARLDGMFPGDGEGRPSSVNDSPYAEVSINKCGMELIGLFGVIWLWHGG